MQEAVEETTFDNGGAGLVRVSTPDSDELYANQFRPDDPDSAVASSDADVGFYASDGEPAHATYDFRFISETGDTAGLIAAGSGNIVVMNNPTTDGIDVHLTGITDIVGEGTGHLDVRASGNIDLTETDGDLRIGDITSTSGDVTLATVGENAAIFAVAGVDDETPYISGDDISLYATAGIGAAADFLEINSSPTGLVFAEADSSVFITETQGAINLDGVVSNMGDVSLRTLQGSILDGLVESDDLADVQGRDIDLVANEGGIGDAENDLEIYGAGTGQQYNTFALTTANPEDGRLYATADNGIFIMESNAALNVLLVDSATGDVRLSVWDTPLVKDPGDPFGEDLIILNTPGQTLTGTPIASGQVTALSGIVTLDAGDDVHIPLGTLVQGGSTVIIRGDQGGVIATDPDEDTGTTIDIRGDVLASTVEVTGGAGMDFIQITGTGGVNPTGNTLLRGNSADDRFFIQSVSGPTTIEGGQGADRYYVSSDASKAGFSTRGFFDLEEADPGPPDPFDLLTGTLDHIADILTIDTGTGGDGGTRDVIRVSAGGNEDSVDGVIDIDPSTGISSVLGLGMPGRVDFEAPSGSSAFVMVGLSGHDDSFRIKAVDANIIAYVQGRAGNDTIDVGNDDDLLDDISGVVAFFGEGDSDDTLNIHGNATAGADTTTGVDPDQLTAIGLTGLGMGDNLLLSTHNAFGAGYDTDLNSYPGAVYYAERETSNGIDSFSSTVEHINVLLGDGPDTLTVDSVYDSGTTVVHGGDGADSFTIGSTSTGLFPNSTETVDFINSTLRLFGDGGSNTIIVNDSGDNNPNVGTYSGNTVSGLDMEGSIEFYSADVEIKLGVQADTFYVPTTNDAATTTLRTGQGFDTVYVGTVAGNEAGGSLDGILGHFTIEGEGPDARDTLYLNDQDSIGDDTYLVDNEEVGKKELLDGRIWPIDTTSVTRTGTAVIEYRTMETVVLNAGQGANTVNVHATHREQSTEGGKNSTFAVNGGGGNDTINLGSAVGNGLFSLASFAIDLEVPPDPDAVKGIPVLINGQDGENDAVHFLDTAAMADTNLAFAEREFGDLFPAAALNLSHGSIAINVTGAPSDFSNVNIQFVGDDTITAGAESAVYDADAKTMTVRVHGSTDSTLANIAAAIDALPEFTANAFEPSAVFEAAVDLSATATTADNQASFFTVYSEIFGEAPDSTTYATVVLNRQGSAPEPLNVSARTTEVIEVSLGAGEDVIQLTNGSYAHDIRVNGGEGQDTFNVENEVDMFGHTATFNGDAGDDLVYVDFEPGVPDGAVSLTFNGGANSNNPGDRFRIAGDGVTSGGEYHPSGSTTVADSLTIAGNLFMFTGVEPLVVHGLPDFQVVTPDQSADLMLDSVAVADLQLPNLVLKTVTVDGVISWTEQTAFTISSPQEPLLVGKVLAISGDTLAVAADLEGHDPDDVSFRGVVYIYEWDESEARWQETAKLYPGDRSLDGSNSPGEGFGASLALVEDTLFVGAPGDDARGFNAGAVYAFEKNEEGSWSQVAKLKPITSSPFGEFGASVAYDGTTLVVGAPSTSGGSDRALIFYRSGSGWVETDSITINGTDFGRAVAVAGDYLAVGMPEGSVFGGGAVAVYQRGGNNMWSRHATLTPSNPDPDEEFGTALAMVDGKIVVGAPGWDGIDDEATDQGRAFVFELDDDGEWVRTARLTAEGGLPVSESEGEGNAGDRFGTGVAIESIGEDSSYVVVGASGFDGDSNDQGAAYVYYQLPDSGSGNGPTWVRSSGPSGSGRLEAVEPAGTDPDAPEPDHFGASVAIDGQGRVVVGRPGYNDTRTRSADLTTPFDVVNPGQWVELNFNHGIGRQGEIYEYQGEEPRTGFAWVDFSDSDLWTRVDDFEIITRGDLGAFHTFTTDNDVPDESGDVLFAETLVKNGDHGFATDTLYDPISRTLFVAAPDDNKIYVYVNEGLYWRPIAQPLAGADGFGASMDVDGSRLVVGAPAGNRVYVYERAENDSAPWQLQDEIAGDEYGNGRFGSSVAIAGDILAIGAEDADLQYYSIEQADEEHRVELDDRGVVHVFASCDDAEESASECNNESSWYHYRLLSPEFPGLAETTSYYYQPFGWNQAMLHINGSWEAFDIGQTILDEGRNATQITLAPNTAALVIDSDALTYEYWENDELEEVTEEISSGFSVHEIYVGTLFPTVAEIRVDQGQVLEWQRYTTGHTSRDDSSRNDEALRTPADTMAIAIDFDEDCSSLQICDTGHLYSGINHSETREIEFESLFDDVETIVVMSATPNQDIFYETFPYVENCNQDGSACHFFENSRWGANVDIVGDYVYVGAKFCVRL